jgi:hypothetical protein
MRNAMYNKQSEWTFQDEFVLIHAICWMNMKLNTAISMIFVRHMLK